MAGEFQKGQSGNPAGRPKGIPDRRTALRALLEPHADKLVAKAVSLALEGDSSALRMCMDRLIHPMKAKDDKVELGVLKGTLAEQGRAVLNAAGLGEITPDQAATLIQAVATQARIVDISDLEERLERLEAQHSKHS
jgi:hypothetical protein